MADEHNAWLDRAAADELLRGGTPDPVGADPRARAEAARMRAALDALTPRTAGGELPGEEAALAAFRAARATAPATEPAGTPAPAPGGAGEPLVDLAPMPPVRIPAQRRPATAARFGLAAALAGVAVGGLAAVAGTGLLDRAAHLTAGPAPAVSVTADSDPAPAGDTAGPSPLAPQLRPTPSLGGGGFSYGPDASRMPGTDTRTPPGATPSPSAPPGTAATGGGGAAGTDGTPDRFIDSSAGGAGSGGAGGGHSGAEKPRPEDLCRENKAKNLSDDRREYLAKLAGGAAKVHRFCATLLDGAPRGGGVPQSGAAQGGVPLPSPSSLTSGGLGFRSR
ncbi:hypothetical protein ACFY7H_07680 [Streptomyces sp. NPDC012794]|uniref:hypothetical protein n=1 Tax=Streptomyces sp. NPDC012794 TaxID=3364850 RepID=UPI0036B9F308